MFLLQELNGALGLTLFFYVSYDIISATVMLIRRIDFSQATAFMNFRRHFSFDNFDFTHTRDDHPAAIPFHSHVHDYYELLFFVSGDGKFTVEGTEYTMAPGSILITRPGEFHHLTILSDHPYERLVFIFSPQFVTTFDSDLKILTPFQNRLLGEYNYYSDTAIGTRSFFDVFFGPDVSSDIPGELARARAYSFFATLLCNVYSEFTRKHNASRDAGSANRATQEIINYINNNLSEDLSRRELSKRFFFSESQINRLIKKSTGLSTGQYITLKRMHLARKLFMGGKSVQTVCDSCGFNSYTAFFIAYKKHFGCSPTNDIFTIDQNKTM